MVFYRRLGNEYMSLPNTPIQEFKRLRGATASSEYEKEELRSQLQALADKNRAEKHRMDQLLEGVIHSQKGELERRKEEFGNLQANEPCTVLLVVLDKLP